MLYSDGIAFVLEETAAQMLCGVLQPAEWAEALTTERPAPAVGRTVNAGVGAFCEVSNGIVSLTMTPTAHDVRGGTTIKDRMVKKDSSPTTRSATISAAMVVPLGEQDLPAQQRVSSRPIVHAKVSTIDIDQSDQDLPAILQRVMEVLLPRLTPAGKPPTPVAAASADTSSLAYTETPPPAGVPIYDLPRPVQSLVLCTAVVTISGAPPRPAPHMLINHVGECLVDKDHILAKVDQYITPVLTASPYTIAGRPAQERPSDRSIAVRLIPTTPTKYGRPYDLTLRLDRDGTAEQRKSWAEDIASRVLVA